MIAPSIIFLDRKKVDYFKYASDIVGKKVKDNFQYSSDNNTVFLKGTELQKKLDKVF